MRVKIVCLAFLLVTFPVLFWGCVQTGEQAKEESQPTQTVTHRVQREARGAEKAKAPQPVTSKQAPSQEAKYNGEKEAKKMKIYSEQFADNGMIPARYTADGKDINPPLLIEGVPQEAKSLVLIMDDPDAPMGTWDHWILYNIPPDTKEIAEDSVPEGALVGKNSWGKMEYGGPAPPSGVHRYFFKLYALDVVLDLPPGATKSQVESAMEGHILAQAEWVGKYTRRR